MDPVLSSHLLELLEERQRRALRRRADLRRDLADILERSADAARDDEHDPEGATVAFERAQVASLVAAADTELVEVDRAVGRLRSGIHDRCERCGGEVTAERLRARPVTRTCIVCAGADAAGV